MAIVYVTQHGVVIVKLARVQTSVKQAISKCALRKNVTVTFGNGVGSGYGNESYGAIEAVQNALDDYIIGYNSYNGI